MYIALLKHDTWMESPDMVNKIYYLKAGLEFSWKTRILYLNPLYYLSGRNAKMKTAGFPDRGIRVHNVRIILLKSLEC